MKSRCKSKQLPTSILRGRKCLWHVFDVYKKSSIVSVITVCLQHQHDRSYHSALREEDCWSPVCLSVTFVDIVSLAQESWLPFDVVTSLVILFVSSFHICCILAGLRPPKTRKQKTYSCKWLSDIFFQNYGIYFTVGMFFLCCSHTCTFFLSAWGQKQGEQLLFHELILPRHSNSQIIITDRKLIMITFLIFGFHFHHDL